jgi:hypothetical protein
MAAVLAGGCFRASTMRALKGGRQHESQHNIAPANAVHHAAQKERILDVRAIKSGHNRKPLLNQLVGKRDQGVGAMIPSVLAVRKLTTNAKLTG